MSFGLCNKLALWWHLINDILFDFLHYFVKVYLDDILIYGKMLKDYYLHVSQLLKQLQEAKILADIYKYEFYV